MAVFLINVCKFNGCEKIFPSLTDLIHHIENTHIDDSQAPEVTEKTQPTCLPLSYVLRFVTDNTRRDGVAAPVAVSSNGTDRNNPTLANSTGLRLTNAAASINQTSDHGHGTAATNSSTIANGGNSGGSIVATATTNGCTADQNGTVPSGGNGSYSGGPESIKNQLNQQTVGSTDLKRKIAIKHHSYSISASNRSTTPTGSEMDDDEMMVSESEDSNDSWTTEEFSSEFIMRYGSRRHSASGGGGGINTSNEKPFACPVPGCKKRYKNVNGIKYHSKNGHKKDGNRVRKAFKCYCGKSYKTAQRLKNHNMLVHAATRNGSPVDGTNLAAVPLTSPALPSATLISTPVKSPPLSNGSISPTISITASPSLTASTGAVIPSSQIGTNATNTNATCTSPSTVTITQVTHKVPRAFVLSANSATATTPMPVSAAATVVTATAVAASPVTTANVFPVSSPASANISASVSAISAVSPISSNTVSSGISTAVSPISSSTISIVSPISSSSISAGVSPVNIKYDNLGILTPATSPKLIAANLCQEVNPPLQLQSTAGTGIGVGGGNGTAGTTTVLGGLSLKTVNGNVTVRSGGNGTAGSGGGGGGGGGGNSTSELVNTGGGNVGIALVVSSSNVGMETKLNATGCNNKNAVLSASVTAGQQYAEET
uniref:C2H2-type domain-containing protein n=1 Tax=Anopheles funestus TaxID=62324 RepID=A0A182RH82_ANOFN